MTNQPKANHKPEPFRNHPAPPINVLRRLRGYVTRVVDGDTVDVLVEVPPHLIRAERFRIRDIDTPEIYGKNATPQGTVVKRLVEDLVLDKPVLVDWYTQESTFGRMVGYIFYYAEHSRTWISLGTTLVEEGLATQINL